jgi:hypothetical protein
MKTEVMLRQTFRLQHNRVMTSEWANKLVEQRKAKDEKHRVEEEARITDRKRIIANAESKWQSVCNLIHQFAAELNEAWGEHAVTVEKPGPTAIKVLVDGHSSTIQFVPRDQMLNVSFYGGELHLSVNRYDKLVWQSSAESSKSWTDEEVARRTVEYAWKPGN